MFSITAHGIQASDRHLIILFTSIPWSMYEMRKKYFQYKHIPCQFMKRVWPPSNKCEMQETNLLVTAHSIVI